MGSAAKYKFSKETKAAGFFVCFLVTGLFNSIFAAPERPEQIQRAQEILQEDKILRERIEKETGVFIEEIIVQGGEGLNKDRLKDLALLYQKRWLKQNDIQDLLNSVRQLYIDAGHQALSFDLQPEIKGLTLEINIQNLSVPKGG